MWVSRSHIFVVSFKQILRYIWVLLLVLLHGFLLTLNYLNRGIVALVFKYIFLGTPIERVSWLKTLFFIARVVLHWTHHGHVILFVSRRLLIIFEFNFWEHWTVFTWSSLTVLYVSGGVLRLGWGSVLTFIFLVRIYCFFHFLHFLSQCILLAIGSRGFLYLFLSEIVLFT